MGQQHIFQNSQSRTGFQMLFRSMNTSPMSQIDHNHHFIERYPAGYPVPETPDRLFRIIGKPLRRIRILPAAFIIKGLREIPVKQSRARLDVFCQQFIRQPVVEIESLFVHPPGSIRKNTGPGNGEPIGVQAYGLH
jgi:hypothetical protein